MDPREHAADCWVVTECVACGAGAGATCWLDCPDGGEDKCECQHPQVRLTDFHPGAAYWLDPVATLRALRDLRAEGR